VLDVLKDPHWRPRWQYFHWSVGLGGFALCVALQFAIQFAYALFAWAAVGLILYYILHTNAERDFGSAMHGLRFQLAMRSLLAVDMEAHLRSSWKPQLLLLYQVRMQGRREGETKNREGWLRLQPRTPSACQVARSSRRAPSPRF
jgi:potassium/chloride transporter 4/5/6